ncbi:MAG: ribonuclease III, partial [Treponema sp.]|nr:ribonuclease III [Treponema sp.]
MRNFKEIFRGSKKISPERKAALLAFQKPLGLKFRDLELLDLAFHHRSFSNESRAYKRCNNERL